MKFGVEIPLNWTQAEQIDKETETTYWRDAVEKEIAALIHHSCFEFKPPSYKVPNDFQPAPLKMVYNVKQDL